MEVEGLSQQDRLVIVAEKRKRQEEIEKKKRQLEDDKRQLQHLKSKALRERWLLDGASSAGSEQEALSKQLEEEQAKTRSLEDTISRLQEELVELETGGFKEDIIVTERSVKEVSVQKSPQINKPQAPEEEVREGSVVTTQPSDTLMRTAVYSVEIRVQHDHATGRNTVLSANTLLPVDVSQQGVKVYEDEQKVVHEMNGMSGVHQLTSSEVDELIQKADEASMKSSAVSDLQDVAQEVPQTPPRPPGDVTGLESNQDEPRSGAEEMAASEASSEHPVTMVFMGYQNVEDEDHTRKVLGLEGTVKAELVLIQDGKTPPGPSPQEEHTATPTKGSPALSQPPNKAHKEASNKVPKKLPDKASNEAPNEVPNEAPNEVPNEAASQAQGLVADKEVGEEPGGGAEVNKEKQPCKCCIIM